MSELHKRHNAWSVDGPGQDPLLSGHALLSQISLHFGEISDFDVSSLQFQEFFQSTAGSCRFHSLFPFKVSSNLHLARSCKTNGCFLLLLTKVFNAPLVSHPPPFSSMHLSFPVLGSHQEKEEESILGLQLSSSP